MSILFHILGLDNLSGPWYGLWSGIGGDTAIFSGLGILSYTIYRKHQCEVHGCWRFGRHQTSGGHCVCRFHHPEGAPTADKVAEDHFGLTGH